MHVKRTTKHTFYLLKALTNEVPEANIQSSLTKLLIIIFLISMLLYFESYTQMLQKYSANIRRRGSISIHINLIHP